MLAIAGLLAFNATTANAKDLTPVMADQISEIVAIDDAATALVQDDAAPAAEEKGFQQVLKESLSKGVQALWVLYYYV